MFSEDKHDDHFLLLSSETDPGSTLPKLTVENMGLPDESKREAVWVETRSRWELKNS